MQLPPFSENLCYNLCYTFYYNCMTQKPLPRQAVCPLCSPHPGMLIVSPFFIRTVLRLIAKTKNYFLMVDFPSSILVHLILY
jgi:hypothetical protein